VTDTRRPKPCHHDRNIDGRVTNDHRDDCPHELGTGQCPAAGRGCAPCTAPHCVLCGRRHLDNDHPLTCDECVGSVRTDLDDIRWLCRHLRWQASRAGHDGRLAAAAPIPGGDAMVLLARAGRTHDWLRWSRTLDEDHHAKDPVPPLLPLAVWAIQWRRYFGHTLAAKASVTSTTGYFADRLTAMAQATDGPDWPAFADAMTTLRRQLEQVLHDEKDPEEGVACFECGHRRLVRRFGKPHPCRHRTPARDLVDALATYPELRVTEAELHAARRPCGQCDQGGIEDPSAGQSWECLGCRKRYTPGEYANAVRRDLLTSGPDGDGWTHVAMAAEAASTMTGYVIPANTVRRWMDRGKVAAVCRWTSTVDGRRSRSVARPEERASFSEVVAEFSGRVVPTAWGLRLVFWPDVADEAVAAVERHVEAERRRLERAEQKQQLRAALDAGEDFDAAVARLGIHPKRAEAFVGEWAVEERRAAS
jgi:hypothetical protein